MATITRYKLAGLSLAAVVLSYWLYALAAVPLLEPTSKKLRSSGVTAAPSGQEAHAKQRKILGVLFPADSWQADNPKILASENVAMLVKEYRILGDGRVTMQPCTILFFPSDATDADRGRRAIVMDIYQEAVLTFDEGFQPQRGKIGNLLRVDAPGPITIRGQETSPGAGDELFVQTSYVEFDGKEISTQQPVTFRLGPNQGSGRNLRIGVRRDAGASGPVPGFTGLEFFELGSEVQMHVQLGGMKLLPDEEPTRGGDVEAHAPLPLGASRPADSPPVDITCQGPFQFDFAHYVASFHEKVDVLRRNPQGPSDQLNCERLSIYFAPKQTEAARNPAGPIDVANDATDEAGLFDELDSPADDSSGSKNVLPPLEPRLLVAEGSPVVVRSPSSGSQARCERLSYNVPHRAIRLDQLTADKPVWLRRTSSEVIARGVEYQIPPERGRLGRLVALGPGTIQGFPAENSTDRFFARWQGELRIRPNEGRQLLSVLGEAHVEWSKLGTLDSEQIWFWLDELPTDPAADRQAMRHRAAVRPKDARREEEALADVNVLPNKLVCQGKVKIDSPQLLAHTEHLEVFFRQLRPDTATGRAAPRARNPLATRRGQEPGSPDRYECRSQLLRVELVMQGKRADVNHVTANGGVNFKQIDPRSVAEGPLVVDGDALELLGASTPQATVTVVGQPAQIQARGVTMVSRELNLDRGQNLVWSKGSGRISLAGGRTLRSELARQLESLEVTWAGGMRFDGLTFRCDQDVDIVARQLENSADGPRVVLTNVDDAQWLEGTLARRIEFGRSTDQHDVQLEKLACGGRFKMVNRTLQQGRQESVELLLARNVRLNQRSGALTADGPGSFTTTREGFRDLHVPGAAAAERPAAGDRPQALSYVHVDFQRGIEGNIRRREVTFLDQVETLYGPVPKWDSVLRVDTRERLGEGVFRMQSNALTVAQTDNVASGRRSVELEAEGNVSVEGSQFTAWAERITFAEEKDLLILEGGGRADARLTHQAQIGGAPKQASAKKILYWPHSGDYKIEYGRNVDLGSLGRFGNR